jgi:hypothetical protein
VRVMHDHMGNFDTSIDGVNTPETQQADNDYAVGLIAQKVAGSPYAKDTLIFVLELDPAGRTKPPRRSTCTAPAWHRCCRLRLPRSRCRPRRTPLRGGLERPSGWTSAERTGSMPTRSTTSCGEA